jgi:hypothetical protein
MVRRLTRIRSLRAILGVAVAVTLGAARSEKVWAEALPGVSGEPAICQPQHGHAPFDPRRVPQSGGMASRLLAGISVKPAGFA